MATLRNKRKIAAMARETQENPGNHQSQNSAALGITEDYITQVSEEIEGRFTMKTSQEFSRTESHILGALSKLDEVLLNSQIGKFSGTTPGTFRNTDVENQDKSGDRSQNDPHPEVEFSASRPSNLTDSDPDETSNNCTFNPIFLLPQKSKKLKNGKSTLLKSMFNFCAIKNGKKTQANENETWYTWK